MSDSLVSDSLVSDSLVDSLEPSGPLEHARLRLEAVEPLALLPVHEFELRERALERVRARVRVRRIVPVERAATGPRGHSRVVARRFGRSARAATQRTRGRAIGEPLADARAVEPRVAARERDEGVPGDERDEAHRAVVRDGGESGFVPVRCRLGRCRLLVRVEHVVEIGPRRRGMPRRRGEALELRRGESANGRLESRVHLVVGAGAGVGVGVGAAARDGVGADAVVDAADGGVAHEVGARALDAAQSVGERRVRVVGARGRRRRRRAVRRRGAIRLQERRLARATLGARLAELGGEVGRHRPDRRGARHARTRVGVTGRPRGGGRARDPTTGGRPPPLDFTFHWYRTTHALSTLFLVH